MESTEARDRSAVSARSRDLWFGDKDDESYCQGI